MESARTCAPWIYVQDAIALTAPGFVRVTADHELKSRRLWIQIESMHIVEHINVHRSRFRHRRLWQRFSPLRGINISTHGQNGSNFPEHVQNIAIANVPRVNA